MKIILYLTDTHWTSQHEVIPAYGLVKAFGRRIRPDIVVHGGDLGEFQFLYHATKDKLKTISGQTFAKEYDVINRELDDWERITKKLHILIGNHDDRVYDAIDRAPNLDGMADWETQVGKKHQACLYRLQQQPLRIGKLNFLHGRFTNKYHAAKHLDRYSANVMYGHLHEFQTASRVLWGTDQQIMAWAIGSLCDTAPEWMEGAPTEWQHGFALIYMRDDGNFNAYPIQIIGNRFMAPNGQEWDLIKAEKILARFERRVM